MEVYFKWEVLKSISKKKLDYRSDLRKVKKELNSIKDKSLKRNADFKLNEINTSLKALKDYQHYIITD